MRLIGLAVVLGLILELLAAEAQEAAKVPRIGVLHTIPPSVSFQGFRKGLQELGYVEGQHVRLEYRWSGGGQESLQALAAQMVQSKFDVILVISSGAALAVTRATDTVPIVFCAVGEDPVKLGCEACSRQCRHAAQDHRHACVA